jgi:hypothetical protein
MMLIRMIGVNDDYYRHSHGCSCIITVNFRFYLSQWLHMVKFTLKFCLAIV